MLFLEGLHLLEREDAVRLSSHVGAGVDDGQRPDEARALDLVDRGSSIDHVAGCVEVRAAVLAERELTTEEPVVVNPSGRPRRPGLEPPAT